ncbi:Uu.00g047370.m01.CDS01 [Anthostomella pinea]|uniref:Uu.00g047370.m01.CDS01 n=1 Tax=Anthostomella pinea TaxID=933095 RepID=A0AAI8YC67_9PEZI|nr:Uu.00g047370.m01.CDS01 [Anthostomella pinea]
MAAPQPLFGLLPAGQPLITTPSSQPSPTSFLYAIPQSTPTNPKPFAHLAVFLLPNITLPPNTAAAIYVAQNPGALASGGDAGFRFLGGVGPGEGERDVQAGGVEEAAGVAARIQELQNQQSQSQSQQQEGAANTGGKQPPPSSQVLAQRIIQNAFNFLSGFSGQVQGGVEVVPLKAFQEWWRKFENKVKVDPSFLEREQD